MTDELYEISRLLHDASLTDLNWDPRLRTLRLCFSCLRRNLDGSPIEDPTVELRLGGVEEIVAYYSPGIIGVKPSEFDLENRLTAGDLELWPGSPDEAQLTIDSPHAEFMTATSCIKEVLFTEPDRVRVERCLQVYLSFPPLTCLPIAAESGIAVACNSVQPYSAGVFLDIDAWKAEFDAWWTGWQEHWAVSEQQDDQESDAAVEDTFIPTAETTPPDLSYRQPARPPFQIEPTDAPGELLGPIIEFHEGMHQRNWPRMASAWPYFDRTPAEQASQLAFQYLGYDYGRWIYIRQIDSWWCEGNRACVVVRGIEHLAPDAEEPATNQETVVTYDLRRHRNYWVIATWSQGWPRYGSAPKLSGTPAWMKGWELAD